MKTGETFLTTGELQALIANVLLEVKPDLKGDYEELLDSSVMSHDNAFQRLIWFADSWARLMQVRRNQDERIYDVALKSALDVDQTVDTEGELYGHAVVLLTHLWVHGDDLRHWHNSRYGVAGSEERIVVPYNMVPTIGVVAISPTSVSFGTIRPNRPIFFS